MINPRQFHAMANGLNQSSLKKEIEKIKFSHF